MRKASGGVKLARTTETLANQALYECSAHHTLSFSFSFATANLSIMSSVVPDKSRPAKACTLGRYGGSLYDRYWQGRSAMACLKQWKNIRKECTKFNGCLDRVVTMQLTDDSSDDDSDRCAELIYNYGAASTSHLYDVIRNP